MSIYSNIQRRNDSRKFRRRMHAIPAAIALVLLGIVWLLSGHSVRADNSKPLLSAADLNDWQTHCRRCLVEAQYDVMLGDVVRLESNLGRAQINRRIQPQEGYPLVDWRWSVDEFTEAERLIRVSVIVRPSTDEMPRTLHYIWDTSAVTDSYQALENGDYIWVVSGADMKALRWHSVLRDISHDWQVLGHQDAEIKVTNIEVALGMPDDRKVTGGAFLQQLSLTYRQDAQSAEAIVTNE